MLKQQRLEISVVSMLSMGTLFFSLLRLGLGARLEISVDKWHFGAVHVYHFSGSKRYCGAREQKEHPFVIIWQTLKAASGD